MGYDLSRRRTEQGLHQFKELADKKKHIMDEDLEVLVTEGILRTAEIFPGIPARHRRHHGPAHGQRGTEDQRPQVRGAGYGNGPIDATFNTIAKLTGTESELLRFPSAP
jgi:2-isopropylmalate synthase